MAPLVVWMECRDDEEGKVDERKRVGGWSVVKLYQSARVACRQKSRV
jgi:hypothetical protein